jgi:hypothetical protein
MLHNNPEEQLSCAEYLNVLPGKKNGQQIKSKE